MAKLWKEVAEGIMEPEENIDDESDEGMNVLKLFVYFLKQI